VPRAVGVRILAGTDSGEHGPEIREPVFLYGSPGLLRLERCHRDQDVAMKRVAAYAREQDDRELLDLAAARAVELDGAEGETRAARLAIEALALAAERPDSAVALLRTAQQTYLGEPFTFGPLAVVVRPPSELLGELLVELDHPSEDRRAFETALERAPGRRRTLTDLARLEPASRDPQGAGG